MHQLALVPLLAGFAAMTFVAADAQSMPSTELREVMIKSTLMRFNDANLTNNYSILRALAAKPFSDKFSNDDLSDAFAPFRGEDVDLAGTVAYKPVEDPDPYIDADGYLELQGYFETSPSYLAYDLSFYGDESGNWRMIGINVHVAPPEELGLTPDK